MKNKLVIYKIILIVFLLNTPIVITSVIAQDCNLLETQNRRTQVVSMTKPYSFVVHILMTRNYKHQSNKNMQGTAFFIHPRVLLTAGHNVHKYKKWGITTSEVKEMRLRFGATDNSTNLYETKIKTIQDENIYTNRNFNGKDVGKDYGLIILPDDAAYQKIGGLFKLTAFDSSLLTGRKISIAGYPGNKEDSTQWQDSTSNYSTYPDYFKYDFATWTGISGAPVWYEENGTHNVFAIHTNGPPKYNTVSCSTATLLTKSIYDDIVNFCLKKGIDINKQD